MGILGMEGGHVNPTKCLTFDLVYLGIVYDRNHYFCFAPIPKPRPKLANTFSQYSNRYQNHILKGESSYW